MSCFRSDPLSSFLFLLLPLSLFLCSFFFTSCYGSSHLRPVQPFLFPEVADEGKTQDGYVHWRRSVAETARNSSFNSSLILAAKKTYRKDPIDGFKRYTGGWNISNEHYWASVGFTAAPFFLIAAVWFVLFGLCLCIICIRHCCCRRGPYGYSRTAYALSLIFLILFTIAAIAGCVVLYTGQGKFHRNTTNTLGYVVHQADFTVDNLRNVSGYLAAAKHIGVGRSFLPGNVQSNIDDIQTKINSSATTLSNRTEKNSKDIQKVLDNVRLALIIIAAVMLFLAFLGFLFSILGLQRVVYFLVIIGWIFVTGTFILCGVFLLLHNVAADTCIAMDEWVQNPTAHTALDDILPCVDNATAQETLLRSKDVTFQLVNVVNTIISNVSNINVPRQLGPPLYFNQSGPLVPQLCNPFHPDLTDRQCGTSEAELGNATEVWKKYICEAPSNLCTTPGRLTPSTYSQMTAAVNVSYGLYRYGPFLVDLEDCTFVRQTFGGISHNYCPGLRRYSQWVYVGLVMVSAAVLLSLVFWVIYARERRHRVYAKQLVGKLPESQFDREKAP